MPTPRKLTDWTLHDLHKLLEENEQENLVLEYKASLAIGEWTDGKRNELAKDICAFANAAGGTIIIGIGEDGHRPAGLDDGVDIRVTSKEAVESALRARIVPRVDNLIIKEIPNPKKANHSYYVIRIPRSMRAPHMCVPFHRYYRRYNFECVPMEHYEVEDVRRRQSEPALIFTAELLSPGDAVAEGMLPRELRAGVMNVGSVTARDAMVRLYIPRWLVGRVTWSPNGTHHQTTYNGIDVYRFDAYVRDNAGPLPLFPHDDQPYFITRGASHRIILHLPEVKTKEFRAARLLAQVFADGMHMKDFEVSVVELLKGPFRPVNG